MATEAQRAIWRRDLTRLAAGDTWFTPHVDRYVETAATLIDRLGSLDGKKILDVGGKSPFTTFVDSGELGLPAIVYSTGDMELRDRAAWRQTYRAGFFDLVLNLEVIEHMHDVDVYSSETRHQFTYSGMQTLLRQCARVLDPVTGSMLLTTPNACSYSLFMRASRGDPTYQYTPHVRELTGKELIGLCEHSRLKVTSITSHDVWHRQGMKEAHVHAFAEIVDNLPEGRGDDLFAWCCKAPNTDGGDDE